MGHPGKDRTLSLLCDHFYWPGISSVQKIGLKIVADALEGNPKPM